MSLINDALKKAQKLQTQGQAPSPPNPGDTPAAAGGAGRPGGPARDRSMPGQIFLLLAFGAGALIALSVLATVYLLRQPAAPVVAQAPAALSPIEPATPVVPEKTALAPVIKAPPPALPVLRSLGEGGSQPNGPNPSNIPASAQNPAPAPAPALEKFPTMTAATPAVAVTPVASPFILPPSPPAPSLSNPSNGLDPSKPDPKILAYLDAMQIVGVRVSDTGSKVLMNNRVYRENEIVDHLLGLRLEKVESDTLTFVDERGVIYTKNL